MVQVEAQPGQFGLDLEFFGVECELLGVQVEALSGEVAVAKADDVIEHLAPAVKIVANLRPIGTFVHGGGVVHEGEIGDCFGQLFRADGLAQFFGLGQEIVQGSSRLLLGAPVVIAAAFPFGEVLRGDAAALEFPGEDVFCFGQAVEPFDQADAGLAVIEASPPPPARNKAEKLGIGPNKRGFVKFLKHQTGDNIQNGCLKSIIIRFGRVCILRAF